MLHDLIMNKTGIGIIAFIVLFGVVVYLASNSKTKRATDVMNGDVQITVVPQEQSEEVQSAQSETGEEGDVNMDNPQGENLGIEDVQVGSGDVAETGKKVTVNYTGTLTDGTQFDSSVGRDPFSFTLGQGRVIQGWEQGILGMKVGGKRKLTIPPSLGYGSQANGPIPANSTLLFDVELLKVE